MTAPVLRSAHVSRSPEETFALFTDHVTAWWPLTTHGIYGDAAATVRFAEGRLVETAIDGRESVWADVLAWEPPHRLVLAWYPGRGAGDASEVEVSFTAQDDGTWVRLEHRGWERFGVDAVVRRDAYSRPNAWGAVLDHFADVADVTSRPSLPDLTEAYTAFLAEATAGGFGPPPAGEWTAEQTVAHVALNDSAMAAVARAIIHGRDVRFDNRACQDRSVLDALIARCGSMEALVAEAGRRAEDAVLTLGRLDEDQLATPIPCELLHDGEIVLDQPMPWGELAGHLQTVRHLPAHTGQLRDLRQHLAQ
jgi:uncharacterized protein YndB with AHSA1/START domain